MSDRVFMTDIIVYRAASGELWFREPGSRRVYSNVLAPRFRMEMFDEVEVPLGLRMVWRSGPEA